jgi:YegS/Rv2252/BmrU family lipid kinase
MRRHLRERFLENPVDIIAVVGGDGSVMEVLPLVVEFPSIKLALIPYGTGNLLATNLGIARDFTLSIRTLFEGQVRQIDVGRIGSHYFALLAGVGAVAEIMEQTSSRHKALLGMWAYLWDGLRTIFRTRQSLLHVTIDGRPMRMRGVAVVVSNAASYMKPCPNLTPNAEPDDGWLDVCLIRAHSRRDYLPVILEAIRQPERPAGDKKILVYRARHLRIESTPLLKVQADGNIIGTTPVDIEVARQRIQVLVPPQASGPPEESKPADRSSSRVLSESKSETGVK